MAYMCLMDEGSGKTMLRFTQILYFFCYLLCDSVMCALTTPEHGE